MPLVKYISHDGATNEIEVPVGNTIMQGAVDNMLDGIIAECGGSCSCATCHCYIDEAWLDKVPPASEMEKDMLENGEVTKRMVKALSHGLMDLNMLVNGKMATSTVKELSNNPMEQNMLENGKMTKVMVKAP